ncbi:right-handed parallel beta-helix repeat-containing protein [Mucilaginibacter sp. Bleaf8]|uniref:L-rhamnose mutarotase n=1 Tax=Mucilaginibacter sp. Bleaf8 TaxID=2834430 RepID=UPI001BCC78CA|nr:L-rhamnose mutarotase [Mucilaginibacter sp. Bleaf8]MBS7564909.1 right-handed parallel beta-helix repeat-containing protein [Mucilaginibacter sp. Bleaf8]
MTKITLKIVWILLAVCLSVRVQAANIWVSPFGADSNPGTKASPKATLAAALRQARELRRLNDASVQGGIHIILIGGEYQLTEPVFIRPEDSGTETSPTFIEAAPQAQPIISGGVNVTGWKKLQTNVSGLPLQAKGKIWVTDIPSFNGMSLQFRQLWVNGQKANRARKVDDDNQMQRILAIDKQKQEMWIPASAMKVPQNVGQLEMVIHQMWAIANLRVKTVTPEGDKLKLTFHQPESRIQFEHPWPAAVIDKEHKMNGNSAFYLVNHIAFLDSHGEWYADFKAGKLYYWPRQGENLLNAKVVVPALEKLVQVVGTVDKPVLNLHFKGISFQYTTWMRPSQQGHVPHQAGMYMVDAYKLKVPGTPEKKGLENQAWVGRPAAAVELAYTNHTVIEDCRFEHLASTGLDFQRGTANDVVKGNFFKDIGGTGLLLGVFSDEAQEVHLPYNPSDPREVCTNECVENNLITDVTNEDWDCVGIGAGYVKNIVIEHNDISEISYSGISLGWGWTKLPNAMSGNRIAGNKIHHYGKHLYDVSGIYTLSAQPNSIITENYVDSLYKAPYAHDVHHWFYLYCDEGSSGFTVKDNWCPADKFLQNANGPNNTWINNGPQVAPAIKQRAGLQPEYRHLLNYQSIKPSHAAINHVSFDVTADKPQVIELVDTLGQALDADKVKAICMRNGIPVSSVYKWQNRLVIFGYIPTPDHIQKVLKEAYPTTQIKGYNKPFYTFSNQMHCAGKAPAVEWDNIILTANLVSNPGLQQEYLNYHQTQFQKWPEVAQGFCNADFQQLLVYRQGRQLMLVISIPKGSNLDELNPKTTLNNPRVVEWNNIMKNYQEGVPGTKPGEVWVFFKPLPVN